MVVQAIMVTVEAPPVMVWLWYHWLRSNGGVAGDGVVSSSERHAQNTLLIGSSCCVFRLRQRLELSFACDEKTRISLC